MTIVTNNQPRELIAYADLPHQAQRDFYYVDKGDHHDYRFARYRGSYYDIGDMMRAPESMPDWDGVEGQSYFNGVLFRLLPNDRVIAGRYYE